MDLTQGSVLYADDVPQKILGTTIDITEKKDLETLRDELLNVAMHELKTPLSTVKASLQLLERDLKTAGNEKLINIASGALSSTDRITRLLGEMASPLHVQSREITLNKTVFDIVRLVEEIADNARLIHSSSEISVRSASEVVQVYADRYRIAQVVTNLINNGIKYSGAQPILFIQISYSGDKSILVRVIDNGAGIKPEIRTKVFQKFFRANADQSVEGLGIGLYLCADVILRHGGKISIDDLEVPGTSISFSLPITKPLPASAGPMG